jgi:hypothetical protein
MRQFEGYRRNSPHIGTRRLKKTHEVLVLRLEYDVSLHPIKKIQEASAFESLLSTNDPFSQVARR